jgi:hypothetical protein
MTGRLRSERGFSVVEMLVASAIMITITGAVFSMLNPAQGIYRIEPEVTDIQQRMRVSVDALSKDLLMAGAGTYTGVSASALFNFFAPVMPYRVGDQNDDPTAGIFFRPAAGNVNAASAITLLYVPSTAAQTTISQSMPQNSKELKVNEQANCPPEKGSELCGFTAGMRVLIIDPSGAWDPLTINNVQSPALHFQHNGDLSTAYAAGSVITQVATHTYYLQTDAATKTYQLRHYDGVATDLPLVDNVVKLEFEFYGDVRPPTLLPNKSLADPAGPYTTYGPKPPVLGVNNANDSWPAGENCIFTVQGGQQVPRLPTLASGYGQAQLTQAMLTDGPFCPDAQHTNRFDADLLRVRRVRIKIRTQAPAGFRGPAGALFTYGGSSGAGQHFVPDQQLSFDVTPRNMNLGR